MREIGPCADSIKKQNKTKLLPMMGGERQVKEVKCLCLIIKATELDKFCLCIFDYVYQGFLCRLKKT